MAEDLTSVEGHVVQFYDGDDELVSAVARFAGAGLALGEGVLVVATPAHRGAFEAALRADGRDLDGYVALDAAETLARVVGADGRVDPDRFFDVIGAAVGEAADLPGGHVRVFGEMVSLLVDAGDRTAALALESLWNELGRGPHRFTLLCAYPQPSMTEPAGVGLYYDTCGQHSAVVESPVKPVTAWRRFDGKPTAVGAARRFVSSTLGRWGWDGVADDAAVVISELATNAVLHARSPFHVSIDVVAGDGVRIAVHDESPADASPRGYSITSATGRGLRMVETLAERWGTIPLPNRKAVWAELAEARPSCN